MRSLPRSLTALLALPLAATLLSGCGVIDAVLGQKAPAPAATPSAPATSPDPTDTGLTFEAGATLDPGEKPQWGDPFLADKRFTVSTPDTGTGSWSYLDTTTQCVIGYWQGTLTGLPGADTDDLALTDALLATQFSATVADIEQYANERISFASLDRGPVEARSVAGSDSSSGKTYIVAARAFGAPDAGLVASLDCPAGVDVYQQWQALAASPGAFSPVIGLPR
ncbi:hypothetical protein [Microbacterium sp. SORGH_AS_0888]|uniref:hypothetical protein n=1 Tax=Microbacterium sp. SORGH_AS_0888 TaxID=3041791 RepID=UPI002784FFF8|nr:hypothetical protein [Microbacterium sp. SORGH_AS_0888]MDQ1128817.1 hypothetical protein [Microbacterium sp. SORGH_AS_0888]